MRVGGTGLHHVAGVELFLLHTAGEQTLFRLLTVSSTHPWPRTAPALRHRQGRGKRGGGGLTEWPVAVLGSELPLRDSSLNRRMPNVVVAVTGHSNPCMTAQLQVLVSQRGRKLQRKAGCLRKPTALQGMLFPGLNIAWVQSRPSGQP